MRHISGRLAAAIAAVVACTGATGPRTGLVTRIDSAVLDSTRSVVVSYTIANVGQQSEEVPTCGAQPNPVIQKQIAARWDNFAGGYCLAIYGGGIVLQPGASVSGTTSAWRAGAGRYRLVVSYNTDGSPRALSAPFAVE